jgi:hypothetical protein
MKLNVGISRKLGLPEYGSIGASCSLELELDAEHLLGIQSDLSAQATLESPGGEHKPFGERALARISGQKRGEDAVAIRGERSGIFVRQNDGLGGEPVLQFVKACHDSC